MRRKDIKMGKHGVACIRSVFSIKAKMRSSPKGILLLWTKKSHWGPPWEKIVIVNLQDFYNLISCDILLVINHEYIIFFSHFSKKPVRILLPYASRNNRPKGAVNLWICEIYRKFQIFKQWWVKMLLLQYILTWHSFKLLKT